MVVAILILILFLLDLVLGYTAESLAPFKGASPMMDIVFSVGAALLGYLSWSTFKEQV